MEYLEIHLIVGILQARMSSSRLPGKVMMKAAGRTMLEHMIQRISNSEKMDKIVIATTEKAIDDIIEETAKKMNVFCFRGSENDVLSRFYYAAEKYNAEKIVRLCGDSPLLQGSIIDKVIDRYLTGNYDYVSNLFPEPRTYPDGLGVEVFSSDLLRETHINAMKPSEREHVTFYMWMQPTKFKIHRVDYEQDLSRFRFNLDYVEDYEFLKCIFENLYPKNKFFTLEDTVEWLKQNPAILKINEHIKPRLGWIKSFEEDKLQGFS